MVGITFAATALKTLYKLAMQGWVQSLYSVRPLLIGLGVLY